MLSFRSPLLHLAIIATFFHLNPISVAASSATTLNVYNSASLINITATDSCIEALRANVTCYSGLSSAIIRTNSWSATALTQICTDDCSSSLEAYISNVDDTCGTSTTYNISDNLQTASLGGQKLFWQLETTCLKDSSSGEYCNLYFQDAVSSGSEDVSCSECYLNYMSDIVNSQWGQSLVSSAAFSSQISECSATGYSVTYTASKTSSVTSASSAVATTTSNARCNSTGVDVSLLTVSGNETCLEISAAQNVSTSLLASTNGLDLGCTYIADGDVLCLPKVCEIYLVQTNDTCTSILSNLTRSVTKAQLVSWNYNLNSACSNLAAFVSTYICISPLGTTAIPTNYALVPATTAASVPTNAVSTSNTDCGYWYTIQNGDTCDSVQETFGISAYDFSFLNPQIDSTCSNLWLGNSYCVETVGDINKYSSYTSNSTTSYTQLASTINANATRTVNRTTTHFFYSWASQTTTTSAYNATQALMLESYTLCDDISDQYNITSADDLTDDMYSDEEWMSEYERVCDVDLSSPLPTIGFNSSITLTTATYVATETATATTTSSILSAGGSATMTGAARTSSAPTTIPTGTITNCYAWHVITSGDYCGLIEEEFGISFSSFQTWNPSIGVNCDNLIVGDAYCVDGDGVVASPSTISASATVVSGTTSTCYSWHIITEGDYCSLLEQEYGISFDLLRVWNPSIDNDCDNLVVGDAYCVDGSGRLSTISTSSATATVISGTVNPCYEWHTITGGDYCQLLEDEYGLSFDLLRAWNPHINDNCDNLVVGDDYCVNGSGRSSLTVTTVSAPASTVDGTTSTCYEWYIVASGDTCSGIESTYGLYFDIFRAWNPSIDNDCSNLQVGDAYCVDGTGKYTATISVTTTTSPTTSSSVITTSSSSGVSTPTPHSPNLTAGCTKFYDVVSGDNCYDIAETWGITLEYFYIWNPDLNNSCGTLQVGYYYCVGQI